MGPIDLLRPEPPRRFGGGAPRNAYVELHNLVAAAASTDEFGPEDRARISRRHGVDLARSFPAERAELYRRLLDDRLADGDLDAEDRRVLAHVARTLALSAADLRPAHERAFGTVVTEAVADDCLSVEERLLLYKLQHVLGLDPEVADGAYGVLARERLLRAVAGTLCDGELSPGEEAELEGLRADLSLTIPEEVRAMLDQGRVRWRIRRGMLPDIEVPVPLHAGEAGRYATRGPWSEVDGRGLRARVGRSVLHTGQTGGLVLPDVVLHGRPRPGQVVLTSRRIVHLPHGAGLPDEIPLDRVAQLLRFRNGTVVRTKGERHVFLAPGDDNETFYSVLYRLVHEDDGAAPG